MKLEIEALRRWSTGLAVVAVLAWGTVACDVDSRLPPAVPTPSAKPMILRAGTGGASGGGASAGPRAGRGGTAAASAIDAGRGAAAGSSAPGPIVDVQSTGPSCDLEACRSPTAALFACCLPDGSCGAGVNSECRPLDQPGVPDPICPSHRAWDGTLEFAGCCRPNDRCGVEVSLGLGCVERTDLPSYLSGPLTAYRCSFDDGGDAGVDDDGGIDDAGSDDAGRDDAG